jgi:hypothetical protein
MSRSLLGIVALLLAWSPTPILAQSGTPLVLPGGLVLVGTPEEQAACAPDAHRYCNEQIPDNLAVLQCLKTEREHISKACRVVLENHHQ